MKGKIDQYSGVKIENYQVAELNESAYSDRPDNKGFRFQQEDQS